MAESMVSLDVAKTALIVIDMQRDFCEPGGYAAQAGLDTQRLASVIAQIRSLLAAARIAGMLVLHTREGHLPDLSDCPPEKLRRSGQANAEIGAMGPMGRLLVRGEYGHDIIAQLRPLPGETVIDKPGYGAFYRTDLDSLLRAAGIDRLILCGVTTEVCVHSTLREAIDRGFGCITVGDGCAASDPDLQQPALDMIRVEGGIFGDIATATELIAALRPGVPCDPIPTATLEQTT
ncbi:MAG: cysteine hydrolase [Herminiimonas sp.]|nr:cysteine hydrolase [Herminiimonas sp.]